MSDYFPADLLSEILVKLPVKTLIRFTAVSKSWRSIITSAAFIASHLSNNSENQTLLLTRHGKHCKLDQFSLLKASENGNFGINSSSEIEIPFEFPIDYSRIVGSCDGLVCLSNDMFFRNPSIPSIIIWNPSVRNHIVLPNPTINPIESHNVVLGFGGLSSNVYKVVRLVYVRKIDDVGCLSVPPQVEIFSLDARRSWRRLIGGVDVTLWALKSMHCRAYVNGVVHWLAYKPFDENQPRRCSILAFDFDNEVFGEVMPPDELAKEASVSLGIFVIEDSLVIVGSNMVSWNVWMMKEYCVRESWTKLYTIDLLEEITNFVWFWNSGEALLTIRDLGLVVYNPETKETKDPGIYGDPYSFFVDNYVESLVLVRGHG
ncbi:hypothetical protein ABFS82_13G026500 [Erythranthe guttata]|uniref:F-box domain-containing protein n=1 Tax=Erythranthe guttata TaxID=4155 RepID=A0A022Q891_ERYGU|nr:PREDICTED: F-box protein CPR30-like [Erythranthe guttata]EYU24892.1 hypothetical protein MIMGU_mgv1a026876mg [Erythranthe guttata]|eukprot:XP_012852417.1 PREDICTED: F-box protein CPR30-like [Erythranthe guttata]